MVKSVQDYESTIIDYHSQMQALPDFHPEYQALEKKISTQVSKWADLVGVVIFRAENEQTPWTEEELGIPIKPMPLKKDMGIQQVADYLFQVNGIWGSLAIERKGVTRKNGFMTGCDLYSTLFNASNRERFKKEYERFKADLRLDCFKVIVECSYAEFLTFSPLFNGKKRNSNHIGASRQSRIGTIASLEIDGCHIIWAGTRQNAIEIYRSLIRQWIIKNYVSILRLQQ